MNLSQLLQQTLVEMDDAIVELGKIIPPPRAVPFAEGFVFRHTEKLPQQAILQKLSRIPSSIRAAQLLCDHGYFQDQAALQRIIDELGEDALFLAVALMFGPLEDIHSEFLETFFAEEFDPKTGKPLPEQRPMVPRKKIRAYIARSKIGTADPSGHVAVGRTLSKAYSGFVHAASPHIMDTYGGDPPRFHTAGMLGTVREFEYGDDIVNYYYRGLTSFGISSKALGNEHLFHHLYEFTQIYHHFGIGNAP
ncbi:MAG: hypothetical protein ABIT64_04245 [Lysobacteraceae bacterium]